MGFDIKLLEAKEMNTANEFFDKLDKLSEQLEEQRKQMDNLMLELKLKGIDKIPLGKIPDYIDFPDGTWKLVYDEEDFDY